MSNFEYCKDCVSHASCYRNGYCADMLCKPAVTEENIKALQQDNAALQALLNKERDEWHTAFMRHNEEWQAKYNALQQEFAAFKNTAAVTETFLRGQRDQYWSGNIALKQERDEAQAKCDALTGQLALTSDVTKKVLDERDALQAQLAQQCTLEAVEAPATHVVNNYYGLDDERIRQMIRDELNATFNRYGHRS